MGSPSGRYKPLLESTQEVDVDALSNVYRLILNCHAKRKAAETTPELDSRNDVRKGNDARTAAPRVPQK